MHVRVYTIRAIFLVMLSGILSGSSIAANDERVALNPDLAARLSKRVSELTNSQLLAFNTIYAANTTDSYQALKYLVIQGAPVIEYPRFWVDLVNDQSRSDRDRTICVVLLFLRHLRLADSLPILGQVPGMENWFNDTNLLNATVYSTVPVRREVGQTVFLFQPEFMRKEQGGVYFTVSKSISVRDLISIINGDSPSKGVAVMEVSP